MAKVTLEFDYYEDRKEYNQNLRGPDAFLALWEFKQYLRSVWKEEKDYPADYLIEILRNKFQEILEDNDISEYLMN